VGTPQEIQAFAAANSTFARAVAYLVATRDAGADEKNQAEGRAAKASGIAPPRLPSVKTTEEVSLPSGSYGVFRLRKMNNSPTAPKP
jgi:hypothetical protein